LAEFWIFLRDFKSGLKNWKMKMMKRRTKREKTQEEMTTNEPLAEKEKDQQAGEPQRAEEATEIPAESPAIDWETKHNELHENYLRLFSEFDNFRKRSYRERTELIQTASADILTALLVILDDFDRAFRFLENTQDPEEFEKGISLIREKFKSILTQQGLTEMIVEGEGFNPDLHEAVTRIAAPEDGMKGKILEVVVPGYKLGEKILRYPKVVVAS
jgi:molecular chaperone GrpE